MNKQKTLIFFGAHPDDESFGMGSTLALYVLKGVKVFYVCSTGGEEGTVDPEYLKGFASIAELRKNELERATQVLGIAGVISLGYRDSGMRGAESNKRPNALTMAPIEEVAGKMVKIIRELKPEVVITHDAGGGYGHPDHIATHKGAVKAFYAAGDPAQYPEAGPAFKPQKLYFGVRPRGLTRLMIRLMPLFGQDPRRSGRNKDIDMTRRMVEEYPIHAVIRLTKQVRRIRARAAACHASQGGGQPRRGPFLFRLIEILRRKQDYYMREYPPPTKHKEKDLFEGLPQ
jgi:LmbE family N-acetylglucosaminyl deacetylase